jgi:hypothetical protein
VTTSHKVGKHLMLVEPDTYFFTYPDANPDDADEERR